MCFVDLEKAFDRVPKSWYSVGSAPHEYGVRGPLLRAVRSLYDRSRSLVRIAGRFLGVARGRRESRFGNHRISSLLFADDVVLMASSGQDLQHVLERFAVECEAAGMRISTSKSEAMVLDRKRVACPLQVGGEVLPQVEEFKYLGVLFTSEGKIEREIDRRIDCSVHAQLCGRCSRHVPPGGGLGEDPGHAGEDYVSRLAWERLGVPPEELEEVSGVREVWASLLRLLPPRPGPGPRRMKKMKMKR
ncbi:hypothetical protein L3Q82_008415 [Scortum barcoo]|uniref:Uncharacterized protein n=1 Tax=Scortum barcoo TaxID=214431 RepID=A0ACB8XCZ0_9TELE|nr:hypothetical protein L3Q82_008415 [Scortum barcoo]